MPRSETGCATMNAAPTCRSWFAHRLTRWRRGREIEPTEQQARFIVLPSERTELARLKLDRSPWLRAEVTRQNWHFLKWAHLDALAAREGASLEWLEPILGLDPLIERGGEQLTMFGE
jgi:hypothetical protein